MAKLSILTALIESGHKGLALSMMLFTVVGAYYYLYVIKVIYFEKDSDSSVSIESSHEADKGTPPTAPLPGEERKGGRLSTCLLGVHCLAILGIGLFPQPLFSLCRQIVAVSL